MALDAVETITVGKGDCLVIPDTIAEEYTSGNTDPLLKFLYSLIFQTWEDVDNFMTVQLCDRLGNPWYYRRSDKVRRKCM